MRRAIRWASYFVKTAPDKYEVLDGQQLNTSFGRFATGKLAIKDAHDEMCGLKWGDLYERFHKTAYNVANLSRRVAELMDDDSVTDKRGIFEYLLGGETEPKLINVRVFKPAEAKAAYRRQTDAANCQMLCKTHNRAKGNR